MMAAGVMLREHALYTFAIEVLKYPNARLIYSDEDEMALAGYRQRPFFKPDFSPELLRSLPYLGRCCLLHDAAIDLQGLLDQLFLPDGVADDLSQLAQGLPHDTIYHIPAILFHDRKPVDVPKQSSTPKMLDDLMLPSISIIIPTHNGLDVLEPCLSSIRQLTSYPMAKFEIIVVDNNSNEPETIRFLTTEAASGSIRLLSYARPFNYSAINNYAVSKSAGEVLVFLNNDTEVIRADWLQFLASYATQRDVGAVGTKLLYPDHTIQHAGVVLGIQGVADHAHRGLTQHASGYYGLARLTHEVSAVTGACLAMRRRVFQQVGGFDDKLSVAFNDILLCMKALSDGYRNICIGDALLIHHELKITRPG